MSRHDGVKGSSRSLDVGYDNGTILSLNTALMNFAAASNVFPLSDINLHGIALLTANHLRHLRNVSVDMSVTIIIEVYCLGDTAGEEANPHLVGYNQAK